MKEARELVMRYWINRATDRELYFRVKRELPLFRKFFTEQLGWRLIVNERIIKLEKVPAQAETFMGIQDFSDIRDYCILCALLIFLEDREDDEQFLLSELVDMISLQLKKHMEVDWTEFNQRKSLIRALQYAESIGLLVANDGSSSKLSGVIDEEVLYENTGLSRYFATSFNRDISKFTGYHDFEVENVTEIEEDRGHYRINRVYRKLVTSPAMYWPTADAPDAVYLKNQRQWVAKNLVTYLGGNLQIHQGGAFFVQDEDDTYGIVHPNEMMVSGIVLFLCAEFRQLADEGHLQRDFNDCIFMEQCEFMSYLQTCKEEGKKGWSKEYREMGLEKMTEQILNYMEDWLMLRRNGNQIVLYPAVGKFTGAYPKDFKDKVVNEDE